MLRESLLFFFRLLLSSNSRNLLLWLFLNSRGLAATSTWLSCRWLGCSFGSCLLLCGSFRFSSWFASTTFRLLSDWSCLFFYGRLFYSRGRSNDFRLRLRFGS